MGVSTNESVFKKIILGGFIGYGLNDEEFKETVLAIEKPKRGTPFTTFEHFIRSAWNKVNSSAPTSLKAIKKLARDNRIDYPVEPRPSASEEEKQRYTDRLNVVNQELTLLEAERRFRLLKR